MIEIDRRSVSTTLGYVLMLAVASLLVVGLLVAGGDFVKDQREQVIRSELEVVGQQIAGDITAADRLVESSDTGTPLEVEISQQRPGDVTGSTYNVHLVEQKDPHLKLNSTRPEVSVTVEFQNTTNIGESKVKGGDIAVVYDTSEDELVIEGA